MIKKSTWTITLLFITIFLLNIFASGLSTTASENPDETDKSVLVQNQPLFAGAKDYAIYIQQYKEEAPGNDVIFPDLSKAEASDLSIEKAYTFEGKDNVLKIYEGTGYVELSADVRKSGLYQIGFEYFVLEGTRNDPEFKIEIDGSVPFSNAEDFRISRIWENDGPILTDTRGNEIRPGQKEVRDWQSFVLGDRNGIFNEPYSFFFNEGKHTLRIYLKRSNLALSGLKLFNTTEPELYKEYIAEYLNKAVSDKSVTVQAEKTYRKSSPALFPIYDRSSAGTIPNDPAKILLNTIGSSNWKYHGEWISWKVEIPEDGIYELSFRVRQDIVRGMNSTRALYIDGKIPFKEAASIVFPYKTGWYAFTPSIGKESMKFYFEKGVHEIKLEAVPGMVGMSLRNVENMVNRLSGLYRRIIVLTGTSPDVNRDYYLEENIPGLLDDLKSLAGDMRKEAAYMESYIKTTGSMAAQLTEIARQLESYAKEPFTIPLRLQSFENNITTLGTWLRTLREQPLEIDYFQLLPPGKKPANVSPGIFLETAFLIKAFLYSFIVDYDSVGDVYKKDKSIDVWVPSSMAGSIGFGSGREQVNIIKQLIDDDFTKENGTGVNLRLVDSTNTILQATFAGKGPDAALCIPKAVPVDWAMRGALSDLSKYSGFDGLKDEFHPSAWIPYGYQDGIYAFPETQSYNMFFYRKDIFDLLGLKPPDTWEDFYDLIPKLQKNKLDIGMPSEFNFEGVTGVSDQIFQSLLFQRGTTFYTKDLRETNFDSPEALDAFKEWTGFFSRYGLPLSYAFFNRFRTGEMPCGFADYTMYSLFKVAAPELNNLWEMAPIPGTKKEDGNINRTTTCSGMGCVVFSRSKKKDTAVELLKWWVSADTQAKYARNLESILGVGARYPTANKIAFEEMPWSAGEAASLKAQWEQTWDVPQIPGSYYVNRSLSNAFRRVVYHWENERETLFDYSRKMNKEILRKRKEFGLEGVKK